MTAPYREPAPMPPRDPLLEACDAVRDSAAEMRRVNAGVRETTAALRASTEASRAARLVDEGAPE